ncbi:hypothetical protein NP511_05370 [Natrinema thermotolerans]|uniref:Uncharacterized protein n=1 Tax=Natrinema thermotolerans TaxID=121872 RepID=A0AAF0T2F8_9EURY|nr:hypothetical protein [Natrinema thermotolerans]QCC57966.1 hypothetical protein DVR14_04650 [Natrinema thermotolerans]WMT09063.1 hypothetical protein NP511_05370 [Natrinema thermotolerans]
MIDLRDLRTRLEQPAYVGENRCWPCTAVNIVIAVAAGIAAGIAVAPSVGALVLAGCLVVVRYRGYLLPGTPTLTRRYLPDRVLALFGKTPSPQATIGTVSPAELTDVLLAAGIATDRAGEFRPTAAVRERWVDDSSSDGPAEPSAAAVASILGADDIERIDDAAFVVDGRKRVRWESPAALRADIAAAPLLRARLEGWDDLETDERRDLLRGVRLLRDRCPICGGAVTTAADRRDHCCRRPRVAIRAVCEDCDRPLVELAVAESAADPWLEVAGLALADESPSEP